MASVAVKETAAACRSLHWVTKIGSLKKSLRFFETVLGLRVLRHEEFESGCEATCNGPYGGAWSKTMVGWGPEKENFVFELTYNYGIDGYERGDDVQFFAVECPEAYERAVAFGYPVEYDKGTPVVCGPDGFKYKILPCTQGRAERFRAVVLKSSDMEMTRKYWIETLGASELPTPPGVSEAAALSVGWDASQVLLTFVQKPGPVDHGLASGRIANATPKVEPFYQAAMASGLGGIMNPPISLPTPGKADVVVTILADPDGYEICFVGDVAFYDLATPLYDTVDWKLRESRGADGAPPPKTASFVAQDMPTLNGLDDLNALDAADKKLIVIDFGAGWCKKCASLKPYVKDTLASHPDLLVALADVDDAEDLAHHFDVSNVPHFVFIKPNDTKSPLANFIGSDPAKLKAALDAALLSA